MDLDEVGNETRCGGKPAIDPEVDAGGEPGRIAREIDGCFGDLFGFADAADRMHFHPGAGDVVASDFCCDSRIVQPGQVFVAVVGPSYDGHRYLEAAAAGGASAAIVERPHPKISIPQCVVPNSREAYASLCMAQYGRPEKYLSIAGVTGTNGKTTSTWLLRSILEAAGKITGLLGTIEYSDGRTRSPASLTTPASPQLAHLLAQMAQENASHCVMEISSHALDQRRCSAVPLSVAAITNVTRDHFDYHGTVDLYREVKSMIARQLKPGAALLLVR